MKRITVVDGVEECGGIRVGDVFDLDHGDTTLKHTVTGFVVVPKGIVAYLDRNGHEVLMTVEELAAIREIEAVLADAMNG